MRYFLSLFLLSMISQWAVAGPGVPEDVSKTLSSLVPGVAPTSVKASPLGDLYEVMYGPELLYLSKDGRYLFQGDIVDLQARRNLSEEARGAARLDALEGLGEDKMVVFAPEKTKHTVTVFTDIDCAYCVKFHQEVGELNKRGVKVRYLAFPRAGIGSSSYKKAVSVWCADDRQTAITNAKAGKKVAEKNCDAPVKEEYELGQRLGVSGTPSLILDDGRLVPGYLPASRLVQQLEGRRR